MDLIKVLVNDSDYRAVMTDFNYLPCKCKLGDVNSHTHSADVV